MPRLGTSLKMLGVGAVLCIGGPALVQYLRPTEEELFKRFNPELQKRNLETREKRQQDFDDFVMRLKSYAKSDKSIWLAMKDSEATNKKQAKLQRQAEKDEAERQKEQIRKELAEGS
ncbi:assembly factor CBP4 [Paracoccidioides brasiliensis Pb03]|uniref:Cytochrome b mRNA-processing protein 4 n=1 Tax=Paracoccidioides brasiliensis (strain Pb18) TaxID=502780 RepID=C1GCH2_PARBD|nr:assembly factor CBP4 [Paracoccidioides brasiliensis Pb18]EEH22099.1 assembly factor CBP4 [Paracoccidioides brasiliensis Pb03]EEH48615.1 assembly factor CBP4 [Paracoccidioides brasiliensis Pb18]ODH52705.1 assembly factor CBP4 [Paracoccidioides brasiliensis]